MDRYAPDVAIVLPVMLAGLLGGVIGFERELARRPAGLRTHTLVAASACLLLLLGDVMIDRYAGATGISADPNRVLGAVISGIGFLGAGTILQRREKGDISGLTTAASLFFAAAIGATVAVERETTAVLVVVFVVAVLDIVGRFENWLLERVRDGGDDSQ